MLLASCTLAKHRSNHREDDDEDNFPSNHRRKHLKDEESDLNEEYNEEQNQENDLPVLPPIILLDFVNSTDDDSSNHNEDKPKRTIDGNLGYGFNKNNFFHGKHNFYLPDGKSGTAVSIEESLSPYEPTTVTEEIKPITEKTETEIDKELKDAKKPYLEALPDPLPLQKEREPLPVYPPYPAYGQRTKLHKTSSSDFGQQRRPTGINPYSSSYTTAATPSSESFLTYTQKPNNYHPGSSNYVKSANLNGYSRPVSSSYLPDQTQVGDLTPSQSGNANHNEVLNLASYPRYTIENGIKYEHKIVWKYPDGKVSDSPPESFSNSYSTIAEQENLKTESGFRPSRPFYPNPMYHSYQNTPVSDYNPYVNQPKNNNNNNNIHSPKPVQFPNDAEPMNPSPPKEQSEFVSVASENNNENSNYYNPVNYQEQYGQRQNQRPPRPMIKSQYNSYSTNHQPAHKFPISSSNIQYNYQDSKPTENFFTTNGQLNKQVLSKYTPEIQNYLTKVFSSMQKHVHKSEYPTQSAENYVNTDYSNLLSYNPSISQYVKNPASILQAQPTFIQAGNSLVPVIILRVDGAPPIHPKPGANINLKSLLRQYLTHYASSVTKATQPTTYNLGTAEDANPVEDLRHLTETLDSLRKKGYQDPDSYSNYKPNNGPTQVSTPNYNIFVKDYEKFRAQQAQVAKKPVQKIKSVQIIEDPRYTAYKINS